MRIQIVPNVVWKGRVRDWSRGGEPRTLSIPLITNEITVTIKDNPVFKKINNLERLAEQGKWNAIAKQFHGDYTIHSTIPLFGSRRSVDIGVRFEGGGFYDKSNIHELVTREWGREKAFMLMELRKEIKTQLEDKIIDSFTVGLDDNVGYLLEEDEYNGATKIDAEQLVDADGNLIEWNNL